MADAVSVSTTMKTGNLRSRSSRGFCSGSAIFASNTAVGHVCLKEKRALGTSNDGTATKQECDSLGGSYELYTCEDAENLFSNNTEMKASIKDICCITLPSARSSCQRHKKK
uniref:Uncharacterized protein n=1 Tax=Corethron hystrix TaxID=216773 RepID=A0A7S1G395_9STRA